MRGRVRCALSRHSRHRAAGRLRERARRGSAAISRSRRWPSTSIRRRARCARTRTAVAKPPQAEPSAREAAVAAIEDGVGRRHRGPGALQALTAAALALPGLAAAPAHAQDNAAVVQFGRYQESSRDLFGLSSKFAPLKSDSLQASAWVALTDRLKGIVNFRQDTWSGATPIATAPREWRGNRSRAADGVSGASPYLVNAGPLYLDKTHAQPAAHGRLRQSRRAATTRSSCTRSPARRARRASRSTSTCAANGTKRRSTSAAASRRSPTTCRASSASAASGTSTRSSRRSTPAQLHVERHRAPRSTTTRCRTSTTPAARRAATSSRRQPHRGCRRRRQGARTASGTTGRNGGRDAGAQAEHAGAGESRLHAKPGLPVESRTRSSRSPSSIRSSNSSRRRPTCCTSTSTRSWRSGRTCATSGCGTSATRSTSTPRTPACTSTTRTSATTGASARTRWRRVGAAVRRGMDDHAACSATTRRPRRRFYTPYLVTDQGQYTHGPIQ